MKKILLLNTAIFSGNKGDEIIMDAVNNYFYESFASAFVVDGITHLPISTFQNSINKRSWSSKVINESDYIFVCGTNLISRGFNMLRGNSWRVDMFATGNLKNCILLGCGLSGKVQNKFYTRFLYQKILSNKYIHSVRDSATQAFLENMGIKSLNTGCPTTWTLTPEHCHQIPTQKADSVLFTLTDYAQDIKHDKLLIEILLDNYKEVQFWIQGYYDYDYLMSFNNAKYIKLINPNLKAFEKALQNDNIEYIGTRLHAGIKSIQMKKRSIILSVDNRAKDIHSDIHLNCLPRTDVFRLPELIHTNIPTDLKVNFAIIQEWLDQFDF